MLIPEFIPSKIKYPQQDLPVGKFDRDGVLVGEAINSIVPVEIRIPYKNFTQHTIIMGSTGSGKTFTTSRIVERAVKYKRVILDWHGEYRDMLKCRKEIINPFNYPINILGGDIYETVDLVSELLELTSTQSYILAKILEDGNPATINELVEYVENHVDEASWMRESRLSLLRKLYTLTRRRYIGLFYSETSKNRFSEIPLRNNREVYVIDLSVIRDIDVRRIYAAGILYNLFKEAFSNKIKTETLVVVEEAQNIISRDKPVYILLKMLSEIRKFGVGLIIVSQSPSSLHDEAMKNTNTKIIHSIKSHIDLEIISRILYMPLEYQKIIPYLDVGEAVVYSRGFKKPVIVKVL